MKAVPLATKVRKSANDRSRSRRPCCARPMKSNKSCERRRRHGSPRARRRLHHGQQDTQNVEQVREGPVLPRTPLTIRKPNCFEPSWQRRRLARSRGCVCVCVCVRVWGWSGVEWVGLGRVHGACDLDGNSSAHGMALADRCANGFARVDD